MKIQYYSYLLILLLSCSNQPVRETDLKRMNLNGNVKSVKLTQFKAVLNNGVIEKEKFENSEGVIYADNKYFFNKNGMILEHKEYLSDTLNSRISIQYDKNLNILKKHYYNSTGELINESTFENTHNSNGELIEEKELMRGNEFKNKWINKIFKDKKEVIKINHSGSDTLKSYKYEYDKKGNRIKEIRYQSDGSVFIEIMNSFDNNNSRIKEIVIGSANDTISNENYEYLEFDLYNNLKRVLISKGKTPTSLIEFEIEYYN
ncbi:hypothetical protein JBL43_20040 [Aureibaculum sp. A20]|uniref:DUF2963 domain-containing protein n=1 Tax=Aureibaculum flavum TaxID=2795986 RepID=A0ABS0WX28_9FLAO|nr:hypothetical protein [Aureibaculum flavum]MBJ2176550.1 hypothetical protein [Aureibaculum flavum]